MNEFHGSDCPLNDVEEHADWVRFALQDLEPAYGADEPDYPLELIKRPNPDYDTP